MVGPEDMGDTILACLSFEIARKMAKSIAAPEEPI
jgi:hypothetical protein